MIFTLGQFPELDHLDPDQRAQVLGRVPWWTYPVLVGRSVVIGLVAMILLVAPWAGDIFGRAANTICLAAIIAVGVGAYFAQLRRLRGVVRRSIAAHFRRRRPPFCFACGYDLHAFTGPRCPECGGGIAL